MDKSYYCEQFNYLADTELKKVISTLSNNNTDRFAAFLEVLRTVDYLTVFNNSLPKNKQTSTQDFQLIYWGINLATVNLFTPINIQGIPIFKQTFETRAYSGTLLHQLGRSILASRTSKMIKLGYMDVKEEKDKFVLNMTDGVKNQILDILEFHKLSDFEKNINKYTGTVSKQGWSLIDRDRISEFQNFPGNYFSTKNDDPFEKWKHSDIESLMLPLIKPWDSGFGTMMAYDAHPSVDEHFLAEALLLVSNWRSEAGIHPKIRIGESTGEDIIALVIFLVSFHLKHVAFARLAAINISEIEIDKSLTIWGPRTELENNIIEYTGMDAERVKNAINVISLNPHETDFLHEFTSPVIPLLYDLNNGYILRSVSSLTHNPFFSLRKIAEFRNPNATNQFSAPQESWLRNSLYGIFGGSRYQCVKGSIKIRKEKSVLTDIDAAIYDNLSGELALFQIKWQDYFTNDPKVLRSKTINLSNRMNKWGKAVTKWAQSVDEAEMIATLRLKIKNTLSIQSVYLFGISYSVSRISSFTEIKINDNLAIANWPQFCRNRFETGPVDHVFKKIHDSIKNEEIGTLTSKPLPVTIKIAGKSILYEDLWSGIED